MLFSRCLFSFSFPFTISSVFSEKEKKTQEFLTFILYLIKALSFTLRARVVYETTRDATPKAAAQYYCLSRACVYVTRLSFSFSLSRSVSKSENKKKKKKYHEVRETSFRPGLLLKRTRSKHHRLHQTPARRRRRRRPRKARKRRSHLNQRCVWKARSLASSESGWNKPNAKTWRRRFRRNFPWWMMGRAGAGEKPPPPLLRPRRTPMPRRRSLLI